MYDLCIYGHMTVDHIFDGFQEKTTLGAMANVWNAFIELNTNFKVKLNPLSFGEAVIVINRNTSERIGRGNLNITTKPPSIVDARWHHIMYLNQLPDLSFIKNINSGIISADVTAGNMDKIIPYLYKIDYLFISDEDLFMDVHELSKKVNGWVILHYPDGSITTNGKSNIRKTTPIIENLDVLGAGDIFAACFIASRLKSKGTLNSLEASIKYAHENTTKMLLNRKKNEN